MSKASDAKRFGFWGSPKSGALTILPLSYQEGRWEKFEVRGDPKPTANWASTATEGLAVYKKTQNLSSRERENTGGSCRPKHPVIDKKHRKQGQVEKRRGKVEAACTGGKGGRGGGVGWWGWQLKKKGGGGRRTEESVRKGVEGRASQIGPSPIMIFLPQKGGRAAQLRRGRHSRDIGGKVRWRLGFGEGR